MLLLLLLMFQLPNQSVKVHLHPDTPAQTLRQISTWTEPRRHRSHYVLIIDRADLSRLDHLGVDFIIDDLPEAPLQLKGQSGIPGFPCYSTLEETLARGAQLALDHPDLVEWLDIGDSWLKTQGQGGDDVFVLKVTNRNTVGDKPAMMVVTGLHARELPTVDLALTFAENLITGYGVEADATWMLDTQEFHFILQANPDGRRIAELGPLWRKNDNETFCFGGNEGVDLNRNFPFAWRFKPNGTGGSDSECSDVFRGPFAGSEPETDAVTAYAELIFPDQRGPDPDDPAPSDTSGVFIDIHAFGGCVLWPFGYTCDDAPNDAALERFGRRMAYFNGYEAEKASWSFDTNGTTDDFAYGTLGVAAFTFEVGFAFDFSPSCNIFESQILPDNLRALDYAAKVVRAPYQLPAGPQLENLQTSTPLVTAGQPLSLTLSATDRLSRAPQGPGGLCGSVTVIPEPEHVITAVRAYVDTPPWIAVSPDALLQAQDGLFDQAEETVIGDVDTAGLSGGRHILYLQAEDADGALGPVSAIFFEVQDPLSDSYPLWPGTLDIRDLINRLSQ